jgi:dephospho-CoA kinase
MARDGISEQMVRERMQNQWSEEKKQKLASETLVNDNKNLIIPEIIQIDKNLKEHGKIW